MHDHDPTKIELTTDPFTRRMSGVAVHGNTPFDAPFISMIDDTLFVGGCQAGLVLPNHIQHLVSLYPWEAYTVEHRLRSSLTVTMYDSFDQDTSQVDAIAAWVNVCRKDGDTLVHCQAGLNRSNLIAATALIQDGFEPAEAIKILRAKRSPAVLCNQAFEAHLLGT